MVNAECCWTHLGTVLLNAAHASLVWRKWRHLSFGLSVVFVPGSVGVNSSVLICLHKNTSRKDSIWCCSEAAALPMTVEVPKGLVLSTFERKHWKNYCSLCSPSTSRLHMGVGLLSFYSVLTSTTQHSFVRCNDYLGSRVVFIALSWTAPFNIHTHTRLTVSVKGTSPVELVFTFISKGRCLYWNSNVSHFYT